MAAAPIEEIDYFELAALAARHLKTSPASLIRFEKVRLQLTALGVRRDDERIPLWVAPILCTTPDARRSFLEGMPSKQALAPQASSDRANENKGEGGSARESRDVQPSERKRTGLYIAMLLPLSAIALVPLDQPLPTYVNGVIEWPSGNSVQPGPQPTPPPEISEPAQSRLLTLLMLGAPIAAALAYIVWLRRRRRIIRRDHAPKPERSVELTFATGVEQMFSDRSLRKALGNLRRHRPVASNKLNVPAAIRATIRSGGFPQMRFGLRPRSPDYLMFHERESPADHLGLVGRLIGKRLSEENVAHSRYEYFGDPRRLQLIERDAAAGVFPLATVLARHEGSRVMMLQESHDCFGEETSPEWLARIVETERPVLINPRARESWGPAEGRLASLGMGIVAPSSGGFIDYGDYLNTTGNVRRRLMPGNAVRFDLPESLADDRDLLLGNEQPSDEVIAELVSDLDIWLDERGAYWLRALALFPSIDPGFTVFMGQALHDGEGKPLMDEGRFIDLARLPWLRAGRMPYWLRGALARGLTPEQLEAATAAIQAFLQPADHPEAATSIDFSRGENRKLRKGLLGWLNLHPENILSDQLLIEALNGRPPDQLGLEAPKAMLRNSQSLWANNERRAMVLAVAAMVAMGIWLGPDDEDLGKGVSPSEVKTDVSPQPLEPTQNQTASLNAAEAAADNALDAAVKAIKPEGDIDMNMSSPSFSRGEITKGNGKSGSVSPSGSPGQSPSEPAQRPVLGRVVSGPHVIFFDWNHYGLTPQAMAILENVSTEYLKATMLRPPDSNEVITVFVQAHTDAQRSPEYAVGLTQRMATSTRDYLISRGVPDFAIEIQSWGSSRPLVESKPGGREPQNRRVEVTIVSTGQAPTAN